MSASAGVNVLRWSALGLGLFYGVYHQASISTREKLAAAEHEYKHKESLIQQAKAEWAKTHPSEAPKPAAPSESKDGKAEYVPFLPIPDEK